MGRKKKGEQFVLTDEAPGPTPPLSEPPTPVVAGGTVVGPIGAPPEPEIVLTMPRYKAKIVSVSAPLAPADTFLADSRAAAVREVLPALMAPPFRCEVCGNIVPPEKSICPVDGALIVPFVPPREEP